MREKRHWETQIVNLGGANYKRGQQAMLDDAGREVPGTRGYKYFGRAKELPGVKEMFTRGGEFSSILRIDAAWRFEADARVQSKRPTKSRRGMRRIRLSGIKDRRIMGTLTRSTRGYWKKRTQRPERVCLSYSDICL